MGLRNKGERKRDKKEINFWLFVSNQLIYDRFLSMLSSSSMKHAIKLTFKIVEQVCFEEDLNVVFQCLFVWIQVDQVRWM